MYNFIRQYRTILLVAAILFSSTNIFAQEAESAGLKKNIQPLNSALQRIVQLKPSVYEFDTNKYSHLKLPHGKKYGFLAEDVQGVFPELVSSKYVPYAYGKNSQRNAMLKTVDEASLIPLLVASIQEQQQQIQELRQALEDLKRK